MPLLAKREKKKRGQLGRTCDSDSALGRIRWESGLLTPEMELRELFTLLLGVGD